MSAHPNNFGFLRLCFAGMVIVAHIPELMDGDNHREPLTALFHTLTLGEVAVDMFFVISGYLIAGSMTTSSSIIDFLAKRILRIVPAYVVAFLATYFVFSPLLNAPMMGGLADLLSRISTLRIPADFARPLAGSHDLRSNGSMWTIAHEFRCYLIVALAGSLGWLKRPPVIIGATSVMLMLSSLSHIHGASWRLIELRSTFLGEIVLGDAAALIRFVAAFLCGVSFFLVRDTIVLRTRTAAACAVVLVACMFIPVLAEIALTTFGAYILFWCALGLKSAWLSGVNARNDVSYGLYLYGWPVGLLFLHYAPGLGPWMIVVITALTAYVIAAASWFGLEQPFLGLKRFLPRRTIELTEGT